MCVALESACSDMLLCPGIVVLPGPMFRGCVYLSGWDITRDLTMPDATFIYTSTQWLWRSYTDRKLGSIKE